MMVVDSLGLGCRVPNDWAAVQELKLSYSNNETRVFTTYPYSGNLF